MTKRVASPPLDSLRDWYAGCALMASEVTAEGEVDELLAYFYTPEELAERAYAVADAMLRQRAK